MLVSLSKKQPSGAKSFQGEPKLGSPSRLSWSRHHQPCLPGEVLNDRVFVLWKSFRALDVVFLASFRCLRTRLRKSQWVVLTPSVVEIYRKDGVSYWKLSNKTRRHLFFTAKRYANT